MPKKMNKFKLYCQALLDQGYVLLIYLVIMAFLLILWHLYTLPKVVLGDVLRFSSLFILIIWLYFATKIYRRILWLQKLRNLQELDDQDFKGLLDQAYYQAMRHYQLDYLELMQKVSQKETARSDYLRLWSHEIKTPLTALNLLAQANEQLDATSVQQQLRQANYQLEMLLTNERLADFNHDLAFNKLDLGELVKQQIHKCAPLCIQKDIRIKVELVSVKVISDAKWLGFVIEQLLLNAIKYSPSHRQITFKWQDETLILQDQGIGIVASDLPRIFEAGFTGQNGRIYGSATGMGLFMVKKVCQALEIKLEITSVLKQGTCVALSLKKDLLLK
ncbi:sensor histidine kinase [Ligilactobacillus sp. Marseille-Q7487]|uniref:sensor histidine kinase n=1 Tax=Ligilactobacillus sp. Marseille-Q7487 TaxID=3022128 RepID=UPI0024A8DB61|nr:sensor histidine kinase [Ligilactobacillus sp. Marseille-Q7487]